MTDPPTRQIMGPMVENRTAIVTGGATGIGAAVVRAFIDASWKVTIADIADREGAALAAELGASALYVSTDLAEDAQLCACASQTVETFGGINAIVHAACSYVDGGAAASRSDWHRSLDVNLSGVALLVAEALPHIKAQGGSIVLFGSISAKVAQRGRWLYPASKAALLQLARSMALDLAPWNIRVNSLSPGKVWSAPLSRKHGRDRSRADAVDGMFHMSGRIADADEVARVALFLCSSDAGFITGADIAVDGGYSALGPEAMSESIPAVGSDPKR